jgi:hypothetical protein
MAQRARLAEVQFYEEMGARIRGWTMQGKRVVVAGDFNDRGEEGGALGRWCVASELTNMYTHLREWGEDTYRGNPGSGRIDHVLMTHAGSFWLRGGRGGRMTTSKPAEREMDHRTLRLRGGEWDFLITSGRRTRATAAAAQRVREVLHTKKPPRRVMREQDAEFATRVGTKLEASALQQQVDELLEYAEWGGEELWSHRMDRRGVGPVVGGGGQLIARDEHQAGCISRTQKAKVWVRWVGVEAVVVLRAVEAVMERVEHHIAKLLVETACDMSPTDPPPRPSRRRHDGWFKTIGHYRRAVRYLNRMESCTRSRRGKALWCVVRTAERSPLLKEWAQELVGGGWGRPRWAERTRAILLLFFFFFFFFFF